MEVFMSAEVLEGLDRARKQAHRRENRQRILVNEETIPVLRSWDGGFAVDHATAPNLRGEVSFCDGATVLFECLIICSEQNGPEMVYEYKRKTPAIRQAAPVDYVRAENAPVALLAK